MQTIRAKCTQMPYEDMRPDEHPFFLCIYMCMGIPYSTHLPRAGRQSVRQGIEMRGMLLWDHLSEDQLDVQLYLGHLVRE